MGKKTRKTMRVKTEDRAIDIKGLAPKQLKNSKRLRPAQKSLDDENRKITILSYESARKPAIFQCDVCDHIWIVKQARYVIQQKRGCRICCNRTISARIKKYHANKKAKSDG